MDAADAIEIARAGLVLMLTICGPLLMTSLIVGTAIGLLQALTQIQEQTLQYTVKFFAIVLTLFVTAALLGGSLYRFSDRIFTEFPAMIRK